MKQFPGFLFLFASIALGISSQAKIWRVNNTGVPADFTTAQAAHDNANVVNGDTIHFEPSGTTYGSLTINKRLVIVGNGYFLGSISNNSNPGLQANSASSTLGDIYVNSGGNNGVIMGISCGNVYIGYSTAVNNYVFKRNNCGTLQGYSAGTNNVILSQNYVQNYIAGTYGTHTNLVISNNIIGGYVEFDANDNGIFVNNLISAYTISATYAYINLTGFTVRNNIRLKNVYGQGINLVSCTSQNNMDCTSYTGFGNTDGNVGNVDMSTVFAGFPTIGANSYDGRFTLANGSPAAGTGYAGADMGAILRIANANNNLADNYVLSGMPNVPSIFKLDAPVTINAGTMNITVSTKTNN